MQRHAHLNRLGQAEPCPCLGLERPLDGKARLERLLWQTKRGMKRIADGLEDLPACSGDRLTQEAIVAGQRGAHGVGVLFPQPRAAHDIGEQKQHHTRWFGRHGCGSGQSRYKRGTRRAARRRRQPIRRQFGACAADEVVALLRRKLELGRQQGGDLARRPPRIALDLDDQVF